MTAPVPIRPAASAPDDEDAVYAAIADAMVIVETYSRTALDMAAIRDLRGLAYSVRCASAAVLTAASMLEELRPARKQQGGRAA